MTFSNTSQHRLTNKRYYDTSIGTEAYKGPREYRTPFSSVVNGMTTIDPNIRNSQNQALSTFLTKNNDLRNRFTGNQSAFKEARIRPLRDQFGLRRSELQQSIGQRGLSGSSFGDQALTGFDTESQMAIGDAQAKAEMEDLQALASLDQASLDASMQTARDQYAQELAALGLSQQQITQEMELFTNQQLRQMQRINDVRDTAEKRHQIVQGWAYGWMGGTAALGNANANQTNANTNARGGGSG